MAVAYVWRSSTSSNGNVGTIFFRTYIVNYSHSTETMEAICGSCGMLSNSGE